MANKSNNKKKFYNKKNSKNYQSTKNSQRKDCYDDKSVESKQKAPTREGDINDITYYIPSGGEQLVAQTCNYSFDAFAGMPYPMGKADYKSGDNWYDIDINAKIPNIMQIQINPAAGFTDLSAPQADGLNVAGLRNFTRFSAENGKTTQYTAEDTTLLLLSVGQILAMFSFGARALGLFRTYNYRNRSYPQAIIAAAGINPNNITNGSFAKCVMDYNALINKFNKIPIPKNVRYFDKCARMFQNIYLDEDGSSMAQSYCLVPRSTWQYVETYSVTGGGLKTVDVCASPVSQVSFGYPVIAWDDYISLMTDMIDALLNSSLFNFVYSDILRLSLKQNVELLKLSELGYDYAILPTKSDEISLWVNNMIIVGLPKSMSSTVTIPDGYTKDNDVKGHVLGAVHYRPYFTNAFISSNGFKPLLNFKYDNPTIEERVAATRLHVQGRSEVSGGGVIYNDFTMCDWYVTAIYISDGITHNGSSTIHTESSIKANTSLTNADGLKLLCALSKFDWHPYIYSWDTVPNNPGDVNVFGDLQFYTNIEFKLLKRLNDVALLGLFEIH